MPSRFILFFLIFDIMWSCRLAPEHKFPTGHMDCYAATNWAYHNAPSFGGDSTQLAVGGDSAGGNLAAAVCMMARDKKGPKIALQVLLYPMTQPTAHYGDFPTPCMLQLLLKTADLDDREQPAIIPYNVCLVYTGCKLRIAEM